MARGGDARTAGARTVRAARAARAARTVPALLTAAALLATAACSGSGGKDGEGRESGDGGGKGVGTERMTVAMVTHAGEGDTFWDIVKSGAEQAAAKDNVEFLYSADKEGDEQAQLVQTAVDREVDGLIVTLAKPKALESVVKKAVRAGIPVVTINSGGRHSERLGALSHIGQDESVAGEAVGEELNREGREKALCVIHEQGNVSLEERCAGAAKTFDGSMDLLNVDGTNMPSTQSSVEAKLQADQDIDAVVALGAPFAAAAVKAKENAGSRAQIATFDLNASVVKALRAGDVRFAVDQQPYLQGYLAVDELWLHRTNANVLGGGEPVLTGPAVVTEKDVPRLEKYIERGTR
ncbi:sugar ABC transporter substrate-binding protein [Streptomyces sp. Ru87]|uniref:sugar ABC transporter substrate-binding protein n=1 Tax=Streptomyces sp. Ru87 TaxID=2044307 RepID=UPI000BF40992|nr:sugar ABC transporter substrate-binding protein [Streptomyces sp. Ru87]PGH52242.1 sugar ABC transporter substrate-binding protein [Streptomyces sp. Ru87]